jgi:hypothetical protein
MADKIERVTIETILDDLEYEARPGLEYEVIRGTIGKMKDPSEAVIEAYEAARLKPKGKDDPPHTDAEVVGAHYAMASAVLTLPEGIDVAGDDRKRCIRGVVDRVAEDFFFLSQPKPSRRMRSFSEAMAILNQMESAPGGNSSLPPESTLRLGESSQDGQGDGSLVEADGLTAPSS